MNKIIIICPYFGQFPLYFNNTLKSMVNNSFIDWLIITDNNYDFPNNKNIYIKKMTFAELSLKISKTLNTKIESVYKLCDYKPTYGKLFESEIKNYEYWGYSDLDLIFGDLSIVFNNETLGKYDKILTKGHLSLYKNNKTVNEIFMKSLSYKPIAVNYNEILNHKYICVFDEIYGKSEGINGIFENNNLKIYKNEYIYADLDIKEKNFYPHNFKKEKSTYADLKDGHLYLRNMKNNNVNEIIYIHFQKKPYLKSYTEDENLIITPKGIFSYINKINKNYFYKVSNRFFWFINFRIKRKINNIKARRWSKLNKMCENYF